MAQFGFNPITNRLDLVNTGGPAGDVIGPGSSTDKAVVRWNGATGTTIQNSVAILSDAGDLTGLTGLTVTGPTTLNGAQFVKQTTPGAYPYAVLTTDYIVYVDTSAARIIQLPDAPTTGQVFIVKDTIGTANTFNISLTTVGGLVTIDGATTQTMSSNWAALAVVFDGTSYRII